MAPCFPCGAETPLDPTGERTGSLRSQHSAPGVRERLIKRAHSCVSAGHTSEGPWR